MITVKKLQLAIASSAQFRATSENDIKTTVLNEEEYRKVKKLLENLASTEGDYSGIVYHTYQLKSEKSYRAVFVGLPPTCIEQEITDALIQLGHKPVKATNFAKKFKKTDGTTIVKKLPLFLVESKQN